MSLLWAGIRIMIKRENKGGESNGKDIRKSEQKIIFLIREELHEKQKNEFLNVYYSHLWLWYALCSVVDCFCTNR